MSSRRFFCSARSTALLFASTCSTTNTTGQIEAKKVKPYAVTTMKRLNTPALKDIPTLDESGLKGFDMTTWWGLMGPAGMGADVVRRLSTEILRAMDAPDVRERLRAMGMEGSPVRTPEQFTAFVDTERRLYARLVKQSGAKPD